MPLGCDGFATATPKQRNGQDVPSWIHGSDIQWELREGHDVVDGRARLVLFEPVQQDPLPQGQDRPLLPVRDRAGHEGCLYGQTIP